MPEPVKPPGGGRPYASTLRAERAAATRAAILNAARHCFLEQGYVASPMADIARRAGVAVDTVYAAVGPKPQLLRELVETALSGLERAVPAQDRDYVRHIKEAASAADKLAIYAGAIVTIQERLAPLFRVLSEASAADAKCAELWAGISRRRAANMMDFVADLRTTGDLRKDLPDREMADIIWSMNATEYWLLLVQQRGWSPERFRRWLVDCWTKVLLERDPVTRLTGASDGVV